MMTVNSKNWQELKKPDMLEKKAGSDAARKASFPHAADAVADIVMQEARA